MPDDQQRREGTTAPDPDSGRSDTPPRKAEAKAGAEAEICLSAVARRAGVSEPVAS